MQTPQAPATPTTQPNAPAVAGGTEVGAPVSAPAGPTTIRELEALRQRRLELSSQLMSTQGRRDRLVRELNREPAGQARVGIEQRVAVLDKRLLQLEGDIGETGRQLSSAQAGSLTEQQDHSNYFGGMSPRNITTISNVFILFVLAPLAITAARNMWRRGNRPPPRPADLDNAHRLDQIQQAVDTIAIEVERVSEGQRFVTKLMSEKKSADLLPLPAEQRDQTIIARADGT
jgi:hypothetical protein